MANSSWLLKNDQKSLANCEFFILVTCGISFYLVIFAKGALEICKFIRLDHFDEFCNTSKWGEMLHMLLWLHIEFTPGFIFVQHLRGF